MFNEVYGYTESLSKKQVVPMDMNENLLVNSDFRYGIINRRGLKSYGYVADWTGCIDNWDYLSYGGINHQKGYLEISPDIRNINTYFKQSISEIIEQLTLAIKVKNVNGTVSISSGGVKTTLESDNLYIINLLTGCRDVEINVSGNSSVQIEFMKLERGSEFTGMPLYDNRLELLKCDKELLLWAGSLAKGQLTTVNGISNFKKFKVYTPNIGYITVSKNRKLDNRYDGCGNSKSTDETYFMRFVNILVDKEAGTITNNSCYYTSIQNLTTLPTKFENITEIWGINE